MDSPGCASCNVSLSGADDVYVTICGHVFHQPCLFQILSTNRRRCPKCFLVCTASDSQRLFLPFVNETPKKGSLQDVMSQIKQKKHECAVHDGFLEDTNDELCDLENLVAHYNQNKNAKKEKLLQLSQLTKQKEIYEKKINDLEKLHLIQTLHTGSAGEVENVLNQKLSAKTLATMSVVLKREKNNVQAEKRDLRVALREIQNNNEELIPNVSKLQDATEIFVARNRSLRDKVENAKLMSNITSGME